MTREQALEMIHDPAGLPADPVERRELEVWLDRDPELRAAHEQQTALFAVLDEWEAPAPSDRFDEQIYARIAERESRPTGWFARFASWASPRPAWAAAAVTAAIVMALWLPGAGGPVETAPVEKATLHQEEIEYYEALDQALDDVDMLLDFEAFAPGAEENRS